VKKEEYAIYAKLAQLPADRQDALRLKSLQEG
jgi:hypothetical protein